MPEINIQIEYTEADEFACGGQGVLYHAKSGDGKRLVVKQYFQPTSEEERKELQSYIASSYRFANVFAERSHQAQFTPFHCDPEKCIEVMDAKPEDTTTVAMVIEQWNMQGLCGPERAKLAAKCICSLLGAMEKFHTADESGPGCVHRDIKPENLFVGGLENETPTVYPIDFGCCAEIGSDCSYLTTYSEGFSHPDLLEEDETSLQSDIYSVCAVFMAMLLGKPEGMNLFHSRSLTKDLQSWNLPYGVEWKIRKIVKKTVEIGYNSAESLKKDFKRLLQIIDQRGIHEEVLLDASRRELKSFEESVYRKRFDTKLLPGTDQALEGNVLLIGPGGSGKTSLLTSIWKKKLESSGSPLPVYVSLSSFKASAANRETFIQDQIIRKFFRAEPAESRAELGRLFDKEPALILLDGANECLNIDSLAEEVRNLLGHPGVQMIIPSRHSNIPWDCLKEFRTVEVKPLTEEIVNSYLEAAGLQKATPRLLETLKMPMFLMLFLKIGKYAEKYARENAGVQIESPGEILYSFRDYLRDSFAAGDHSVDALNLRKCCLHQFLPSFAFCLNGMSFDSIQVQNAIKAMKFTGKYAAAMANLTPDEKAECFAAIMLNCGLIRKIGEDDSSGNEFFVFAHQNHMEFYKALFVVQKIFSSYSGDPSALDQTLPDSVIQYLADIWLLCQWDVQKKAGIDAPDLVSVEDWLQRHIAGKPGTKTIVRNMVEVLKYQRNNDLQGCKFDGLDLSATNFYHCNVGNSTYRNSILSGTAFASEYHRHLLEKVLLAPTQKLVITSAQDESKLIAWSLEDGNYKFSMDTGEPILQFAISTDEKILAAACSSVGEISCRIYIFSLENGHLCKSFSCSSFPIRLFSFLPGNAAILLDHYGREIKKLDIVTKKESAIEGSNLGSLNNAAASLDGSIFLRSFDCHQHPVSILLSLQPFEVHTVDTEGIISSRNFGYRTKGAVIGKWVFSSDNRSIIGQTLYGNSCNLVIFSMNEGNPTQKATVPGFLQCASSRYVFTSKKVWDYDADLDVSSAFGYESGTECHVSLSVDGKLVAITKEQRTVTVFNTETLQCIFQFQPTVVSADSSLGSDTQIHIASRTVLRRLPSGYVDCLDLETKAVKRLFSQTDGNCLVFCQDSRYALQERRDGAGFTLWSIAEKKQIATFYGSLSNVQRTQYLPEEKALVLIKEKQHSTKNSWLPVEIFLYNVQSPCESNYLNVLMSAEISSSAVIGESIILGTADGELQVRNCTGALLSKKQAHKAAVQKILPVIGSNRVVSRDTDGKMVLWNVDTMQTWDVAEHDPGLEEFDFSVGVVVDASAFSGQWPADSKLLRRKLTCPEGTLFWIDTKDFAVYSRISGDGKVFLMCNMFLQRLASSTIDGQTLFELSSLAGTEIISSASVSDDGELMAVIASNGKAEIYTRGDPTPLVWDVLDVDSVVNADLGGAKLLCSDYIREQLRLNGAILPNKDWN